MLYILLMSLFLYLFFVFFFFKQKTAYEMRISDWSSDVCSSDLPAGCRAALPAAEEGAVQRHRHGTIQVRVVQHHERILPPPSPAEDGWKRWPRQWPICARRQWTR